MRSFGCCALLLMVSIGSPASARLWTDNSLGQQMEAEFVSLEGSVANFRLPDGELRRCDLARLSPLDQAVVALVSVATRSIAAQEVSKTPVTTEDPTPRGAAGAPVAQTLTAATANAQAHAPGACECTVMVPEMVTEMRTVTVCQWRTEQRQATCMACRLVPETRQVTYEYTVPTYETRTQEFVYSVFKPVISTQQVDYTVMVPHIEKRQGVRRECHMVPVEMTCTVCEDHGSWQQVVRHSGCGCCGPCSWTCNVWVPKLEQREVKYTVMRPQIREVPYEFDVTVCTPEKRSEMVQVCNYAPEQVTRSVPYTVCVPVTKTDTREVTCYRRVEEPRTYNYTVCVPYQVEKQVPVQVCRMVPKTVTLQAPACGGAPWCGRRCW